MNKFSDTPDYVQDYIMYTILIEGSYVDNKHDSGGKTKNGITEKLARQYNYKGNMEELPMELTKDIYATEFYFKPKLNLISNLKIQKEIFDSSVNVGSNRAITWLQRTLNVFNRMQRDYKDLLVDGVIGSKTKQALDNFLAFRSKEGEQVLLKALNCLQGAYYIELSENREKDETFTYGWISQRVSL